MLRDRGDDRLALLTAKRLYNRRVIEAKKVGNVIYIKNFNNRSDGTYYPGGSRIRSRPRQRENVKV